MIGFDFPVSPTWITDVLRLRKPMQPLSELVTAALAGTMTELGGEETKRKSLTIILRYFVATEGGGQTRRTAADDPWATYATTCGPDELAPAYLAHLINQNPIPAEIALLLASRAAPGSAVSSRDVRQRMAARFGERKVVENGASAFLRTLVNFGVLEPTGEPAMYRFRQPLAVSVHVFPLLVWSWWQVRQSPQADVDVFDEEPAFAFLRRDDFTAAWGTYQPALWVVDERLEGRRATLRTTDAAAWTQALVGSAGSVR